MPETSPEYIENIIKTLNDFSAVSGGGIVLTDINGAIIHSAESCDFSCPLNPTECGGGRSCLRRHIFSCEQSDRFGGKYIYFCAANLIFITSPIKKDGKPVFYITAGPFLPMDCKDYDIDCLASVPNIPPAKIRSISDLLHILSKYLSSGTEERFADDKNAEIYKQQQQIGEYVQNIKAELIKDCQSYISYPYDKEKQLFHAITSNDLSNSRKYLNEILGHIFFSSANDLNVIKVRAMELTVMISRAAIEAGADINNIHQITTNYLGGFFSYCTIEEVCWTLTEILKKFTSETFEFNNVKHVDLISKAVSYIKTNYMNKITLDEIAEYVYISPSYFSKIFKKEMGCYFNDYLNNIRIEKCKMFLMTENLSLVEIAEHVGFYDQSYFNKVFKKVTGVTPKKFKEQNGSGKRNNI